LVDIDPEMLRIASELPMLKRLNENSMASSKLTTFAEDAFSFINKPGLMYDRVIIDMPDPHNEAINKLYSREFYTMIQRRMVPDGVLVTQSSSPFFTRNVYWSIESTLSAVFDTTSSYQTSLPSFGIWGFHMARNQRGFPEQWAFDIETKSLTASTMQAATVFGKDIAKLEAPVNSIMEPKLYQLYVADLKQ
jgi:spermidine synthase